MSDSPILCRDMDDTLEVINRLKDPSTKTVVYDVETNGLDWRTEMIVGHVITFGNKPSDTYYIPVRHQMSPDGGNVHEHIDRLGHPFELALNEVTSARRDILWIGHHFNFDLMFCFGHGVKFVGRMEDTEVNAALLDEFSRKYSLDECCKRMGTTPKLGHDLYAHMAKLFGGEPDRRTQMGNFWRLRGDDPIGFDYAAGDGVATWDLRERQRATMAEQNITSAADLESDITRVVYRMNQRGIKIDVARLDEVIQECNDRYNQAVSKFPSDFNSRSPKSMRALMEAHGQTDWPMTAPTKRFPQGQPQFNEAWLKTHEIGREVIAARKYSNLVNSFAMPLKERHMFEGRVRCTYHQAASDDFGTSTFRFSCSSPNMQQVPKRNKELSKLIRSVFEAENGMVWTEADYSQCEPRLLAEYGNVETLVKGYLSIPSVDAHQAVADAASIERQAGKTLNQTLITGGGRGHVMEMLGGDTPENQRIYDKYFQAMPEIRPLQQKASRVFKSRGFLKCLGGYRARLDDPSKAYKGVNRLLQVGNAYVVKRAMVDIDRHFESTGDVCHILNTVHDSLSFQSFPEHDDIMREALRLMSDFGPGRTYQLRVPMEIEYGVGKNWAEATFSDQTLFGGMGDQHLYEGKS